MRYTYTAVPSAIIPRARTPILQHLFETYASETNKVAAVWNEFRDGDLAFAPHPRARTVQQSFEHQILSERRFFGEFMGLVEPPPATLLPAERTVQAFLARLVELATPRLDALARQPEPWWLERVHFFDVERERIWVFWRRLLHTAHHRAQLTVYLRVLGRTVPPVYGPTADVSWEGADPTSSAAAAGRR